MQLGFLGLGHMGEPIARNLIASGHELLVWNRTRARAEPFRDIARVVATPAEACAAPVVLTLLADDHALESIEDELLAALPREGVHVSLSTISVALSRKLQGAHASRGQSYVAAPLLGRPEAARARKLAVVAAGTAVERVRPLLEAIGRKLIVLGTDAPAASSVKLAMNFLFASLIEALGEAFALARKSSIEPARFLDVVTTAFQSPVYETYGRIVAEERYGEVGFAARLGLKDLRLVHAAADEALVPLPLGDLLRERFLELVATSRGELDWSAIAALAAEHAGLGG